MKHLLIAFLLISAAQAAEPEKAALASALSHHSPDGKFAMRIVHETGEERLSSEAIHRIELIEIASGKALTQLLPEEDVGSHFGGWSLRWSSDSKWCAFYYAHPRHGHTSVFRRTGDGFAVTHKRGALRKKMPGMVRNEYVKPVRWTPGGKLILYQWTLNYGPRGGEEGASEATLELTAGYDERKRTFRIVKARAITQEEAEKLDSETANDP